MPFQILSPSQVQMVARINSKGLNCQLFKVSTDSPNLLPDWNLLLLFLSYSQLQTPPVSFLQISLKENYTYTRSNKLRQFDLTRSCTGKQIRSITAAINLSK